MKKNKLTGTQVIETPEKKQMRYDLRHRKKDKRDKAPTPPKAPSLESYDTLESIYDFLGTRQHKTYTPNITFGDGQKSSFLNIQDRDPKPDGTSLKRLKQITSEGNPNDLIPVYFDADKWVFTQATAVASVNLVEGSKWQITSDTIKYINQNGNAWTTDFLKKTYKTFVGAMNLKDHIDPQDGGKIYGIILDAVPRKVKTANSGHVLYIDTIIATCREVDYEWARAIEDGKVRYLSVGFFCEYVYCSRCGHTYKLTGKGTCEHTAFQRRLAYYDNDGRKSMVAEVATDADGLGKAYFSELSYLSVNPAFTGAAQSHILETPIGSAVCFNLPRKVLKRPAFQALREHFKVKEEQAND